jgi:hypothetical protein
MTNPELLTYSREHLHYEVWMLEETAGRLLHAPLHFDRVVKNTVASPSPSTPAHLQHFCTPTSLNIATPTWPLITT